MQVAFVVPPANEHQVKKLYFNSKLPFTN